MLHPLYPTIDNWYIHYFSKDLFYRYIQPPFSSEVTQVTFDMLSLTKPIEEFLVEGIKKLGSTEVRPVSTIIDSEGKEIPCAYYGFDHEIIPKHRESEFLLENPNRISQ